ncbi:MAG TPA: serine hydrolase [Patescibacteria group bacterium]|nr:serine hydrolase [Patescibacteria group bacterium]
MFNFLISLIIASQLVAPVTEIAGLIANKEAYPKRRMTGSFEPVVEAESALVLDMETGKILYQKNGFKQRSMASITKLMTAVVFLENKTTWDKKIKITQDDKTNGGKLVWKPGEELGLKDLFNVALIGSVNSAAYELARATDLSYDDFIKRMNSKAEEIGMKEANFVEPTGLDARNKAMAMDIAKLTKYALNQPEIKNALTMSDYTFVAVSGARHTIKNTNKLLKSYLNIEGGKTGYTEEAGYCLANMVKGPEAGKDIVVVILGAKSEEERFQQNKFLSQWVFDNWEWGKARN